MTTPTTGGSPDLLLQDCDLALSEWLAGRHCRKCNGLMQPSKAIEQTYTGGADFIGVDVVTVSAGGPGRLIDCMKCEACGWSVTL